MMLRIAVTDLSAESRNLLSARLSTFLSAPLRDIELLPRISIQPLALEELRFHATPDLCFVGAEAVAKDMMVVREIRTALPGTPVVVCLNGALDNLASVEQIARMGADDTFAEHSSAEDFFRKVVLLARKSQKRAGGTLILVDGGKGGVGVTSIAAAVGEICATRGKRTAVVDLDSETQDLSRFLQARPFINENLQLILDQSRPVTNECVAQCLSRVWHDDDSFWCMSPAPDHESLYDSRSTYARTFVSLFETLDGLFDVVVVDVGGARGALLKTLYRVADSVLFVVNSDPAALYASVDKIARVRSWMGADGDLTMVENCPQPRGGLTHSALVREFTSAAKLPETLWHAAPVTFSAAGSRWPGSGGTVASFGSTRSSKSIESLVSRVLSAGEVVDEGAADSIFHSLKRWVVQRWGPAARVVPSVRSEERLRDTTTEAASPVLGLRLPLLDSQNTDVVHVGPHSPSSSLSSPTSAEFVGDSGAAEESFVSRARVQGM